MCTRPRDGANRRAHASTATAIRRHWVIENGQHWILEVAPGEDRSRVRVQCAARDLAALRRIALDLLRVDTSTEASVEGKHKTAAWNNTCVAKPIGRWVASRAIG